MIASLCLAFPPKRSCACAGFLKPERRWLAWKPRSEPRKNKTKGTGPICARSARTCAVTPSFCNARSSFIAACRQPVDAGLHARSAALASFERGDRHRPVGVLDDASFGRILVDHASRL